MSITVSDCLKLSALREAKVVAGHGGLNKIVSGVSVLEYADASLLTDGLFLGNELIISALTSIKDNVDEQCRIIRRLHEGGEVGLILYYLGVFVLSLDKRVLQTADELDFPIICMPESRFDLRYSEAISEILELVIKDQMKETYFVTGIINRITQLQKGQQTIGAVMRMLSDRLHCTLLLANHNMEQRGFATWPMASRWTYKEILNSYMKNKQFLPSENPVCTKINDVTVYINHIPVSIENSPVMYLISVNENHPLPMYHLKQAAEVIQIFINNWQYDFRIEDSYALVNAILEDDPMRMRRIAKSLNIDVASIHTMWVVKEKNLKTGTELKLQARQNSAINRAIITRSFLLGYRRVVLVEAINDTVVAFMNDSPFPDNDKLEIDFMEMLSEKCDDIYLITCNNLLTTTDVHYAYLLIDDYLETCHKIYPHKRIINLHELQFAKECVSVLESGEDNIANHLLPLTPLNGQLPLKPLQVKEDNNELIDTLTVYLLDAQNSVPKTGELLFLHKNTVKYRINKIKELIGYDFLKMPSFYKLYLAVALYRLLK